MFKITPTQIDEFSQAATERFKRDAVVFLARQEPEWHSERDAVAVGVFIDDMLALCRSHSISVEGNIHKIMLLNIRDKFTVPLDPHAAHLLGRAGFSENRRLAEFQEAVASGTTVRRITLDTDL